MPDCIIKSVDDVESPPPVLATFQNGQLNSDQVNKLQCVMLHDNKNKQKIVAVATEKLTYVGNDTSNSDLCYTLLTIRNKRTNKVRIVPAVNVSLNAVLPKVNMTLNSTLSTNKSTIRDLNKQFGSKRTKRQTEQMERMRMNVSHVEKELQETVADVVVKPEDLIVRTVDEDNKTYRPPINRNASTADKVYNLKDIITNEELETLHEMANEIIENDVVEDKYMPFVCENIQLFKNLNHPKMLQKISLLLYMDAITKFFKTPIRMISKRNLIIDSYNSVISNKIQDAFTLHVGNQRTRPISMRDKATCYLIILGLIIFDFKLNLESLSKSINVGIKKLQDVSRVLGAQPENVKNKNTIVLKLPLPTLPTFVGKRKK